MIGGAVGGGGSGKDEKNVKTLMRLVALDVNEKEEPLPSSGASPAEQLITAARPSTLRLVRSSLQEARPTIALTLASYGQVK